MCSSCAGYSINESILLIMFSTSERAITMRRVAEFV